MDHIPVSERCRPHQPRVSSLQATARRQAVLTHLLGTGQTAGVEVYQVKILHSSHKYTKCTKKHRNFRR